MHLDFDLHGLLALRFEEPSVPLRRYVERQLDLVPRRPADDPDFVFRQTPELRSHAGDLTLGDAGDDLQTSTDGSHFVVSEGDGALALPIDALGSPRTICYARDGDVPRNFVRFVRPMMHLALLEREAAVAHASAISYRGRGVLLAGWAESGKSEAALGFVQHGASFVSDKWTILKSDGCELLHFPTPVTLRGWLLEHVPPLRSKLSINQRGQLKMAGVAQFARRRIRLRPQHPPLSLIDRAVSKGIALGENVSVTPSQLFGDAHWSRPVLHAPFDVMFILLTRETNEVVVRPADRSEVAERLAECAMFERRHLLDLYTRYRYAYPSKHSELIERWRAREMAIISRAISSKPVYTVETPFPFVPQLLYDALSTYC